MKPSRSTPAGGGGLVASAPQVLGVSALSYQLPGRLVGQVHGGKGQRPPLLQDLRCYLHHFAYLRR